MGLYQNSPEYGYYEAAVLDPEGNRVELLAGDYSDNVALRPSR